MQENDGFATHNHENGVEQFWNLAVDEQRHPKTTGTHSIPRGIRADGGVEPFGLKLVQKGRNDLGMGEGRGGKREKTRG
jgi:hypothetical protein